MTVEELIKKLQGKPAGANVFIHDVEADYADLLLAVEDSEDAPEEEIYLVFNAMPIRGDDPK